MSAERFTPPNERVDGILNVYARNEFVNEGHPVDRDFEFRLLTLNVPATCAPPLPGKEYVIEQHVKDYIINNYDDLKIIMDNLKGIPEPPGGDLSQIQPLYFCYHNERGYAGVCRWGEMVGLWVMFFDQIGAVPV